MDFHLTTPHPDFDPRKSKSPFIVQGHGGACRRNVVHAGDLQQHVRNYDPWYMLHGSPIHASYIGITIDTVFAAAAAAWIPQ